MITLYEVMIVPVDVCTLLRSQLLSRHECERGANSPHASPPTTSWIRAIVQRSAGAQKRHAFQDTEALVARSAAAIIHD